MTKPQYEKPRIDVLARQPASIRPLLEDAIREAQIKMLNQMNKPPLHYDSGRCVLQGLRDLVGVDDRVYTLERLRQRYKKMESNR